jgi:protein SCO1/2
MNKILISLGIIAIAAIIVLFLVINPFQKESLKGTVLNKEAIDFELKTLDNKTFKLSDHKGKVIAMTFVYSHCPDVCPVLANRFSTAAVTLMEKGYDNFIMLLISVDFAGDTYESVMDFLSKYVSKEAINKGKVIYLLGKDLESLNNIWKSYGVYVATSKETGNYTFTPVAHTAVVHIIDKKFKWRVSFVGMLWNTTDLVHDMEILLKE